MPSKILPYLRFIVASRYVVRSLFDKQSRTSEVERRSLVTERNRSPQEALRRSDEELVPSG